MGLGGSAFAPWRAFASCGRTCGTARIQSVKSQEGKDGKASLIAYRHVVVLPRCLSLSSL